MRGLRSILVFGILIIVFAVSSVSSMFKVITGNVKDFNTMAVSDFEKGTLVKGDIALGVEFATRGSTHYFVINTKTGEDEDPKLVIFSTSNKDLISRLNEYEENIPIKGKIAEIEDDVYKIIKEDLGDEEYTAEIIYMMIEDYNYSAYALVGFGILAVIIILAVVIVKKRKADALEKIYTEDES